MSSGLLRIAAAVGFCLGPLIHSANAQGVKVCAGVTVPAIHISTELDRGDSFVSDPSLRIVELAAAKIQTLVALGPPLGSMDSPDIKIAVGCTQRGIEVTATITRSANFNGDVAQNVVWRPTIQIQLALRQPEVISEVVWRMRLTSGAEVKHAQSPAVPYPDQNYPIILAKTVHSVAIRNK